MIIRERIFYIMEQKNMSQLELSRRTGIATSNISDWKKKKTNPKAETTNVQMELKPLRFGLF